MKDNAIKTADGSQVTFSDSTSTNLNDTPYGDVR